MSDRPNFSNWPLPSHYELETEVFPMGKRVVHTAKVYDTTQEGFRHRCITKAAAICNVDDDYSAERGDEIVVGRAKRKLWDLGIRT